MTIDLAKLPRVLQVQVPRVDPATGKPTKPLIDWEQSYSGVIKGQLGDLQNQVTLAKSTADNAAAAVMTEATARADGDTALAGQITTVDAKANNATASGAIYFAAKAAPTGASAAYGLYLTAGASFAGFEIIALSGGGSAINMTANKLSFSDSGTATPVFSYSSGLFTFNVPVQVRTGDLANNAVTNVGATSGTVSAGGTLSFSMTTGGGDLIVMVTGTTDASVARTTMDIVGGTSVLYTYSPKIDGASLGDISSYDMCVGLRYFGGSSYQGYSAPAPVARNYVVTGVAAGAHTLSVNNPTAGNLPMSIVVLERKR